MTAVFHESVASFLAATTPFLLSNETMNAKLLGLVDRLKSSSSGDRTTLIEVREGAQTLGVAIQARPDAPLLLSPMPSRAITHLVQALPSPLSPFTELIGPRESIDPFVTMWGQETGQGSILKQDLCLYELRKVQIPPSHEGKIICAREEYLAEATELVSQFMHSVEPDSLASIDNVRARTLGLIQLGRLYLLRSPRGECVSMCAKVRQTPNGASISLVYSPPNHRGRGFASMLVAGVSQKLLKEGKQFINLFAALDNQTSNALYQRIGSTFIAPFRVYQISP